MSNMKRVLEWLTGPDAFFEVDNTPNHRLISVLEGRMQFISDTDLAHMMSMCEAESVNRMAQQYTYMGQ